MRVLVTGAAGLLGSGVVARLAQSPHEAVAAWHRHPPPPAPVPRVQIDLATASPQELAEVFDGVDVVVNTAYLPVGAAGSAAVNVDAVGALHKACRLSATRLVHVSSDVVFAGGDRAFTEADSADPLPGFVYGEQKAAAESLLADDPANDGDGTTIVRTSLLYDLRGGSSAEAMVATSCRSDSTITHFVDEFRCPVHVDDVAEGIVALLERDDMSVVHLAGPELLSRAEFARRLAPHLGVPAASVPTAPSTTSAGPRPRRLELDSTRAAEMLGWRPRRLA